MGDAVLPQVLATIAAARKITAEDTLAVRRSIYGELAITPIEAETLMALDEALLERCPEWDMLFVEALTDYVVNQQHPPGYVDDAGADWLISLIGRDGQIRTETELDLLVHILETADRVPGRLSDFALAQGKDAVLNGDGPLARSGRLQKGLMGADEVTLLRRILYAAGGPGNIAITRSEAETLFDINDAVRGQPNDPSWNDLFAKAIGAAVMTVSTYEAPSSEVAARDEAWLAEPESMGGFISRMFSGKKVNPFDGVFGPSEDEQAWEARNAANEDALARAEVVAPDEAAWLQERIGRDGEFDPAEKALVAFLRGESPQIDEGMAPLIDEEESSDPQESTPVFGRRRSKG
jgi:hypothetical protein